MKALSNLRLGVRLGAGFGIVVLALALVGFVGSSNLGTLSRETDELSGRALPAIEHLGSAAQQLTEAGLHTTQHLYVYDGDLKSQDELQKEATKRLEEGKAELAKVGDLVETESSEQAYAKLDAAVKAFAPQVERALADSRRETVEGVEERDASRDRYVEQIVPAVNRLSEAEQALTEVVAGETRTNAGEASATGSGGKHTILITVIAAVLAAIALALWTTRSVTKPVKRLLERMSSLAQRDAVALERGLDAFARGDLTAAVAPATEGIDDVTEDEIGQLSGCFNDVNERIRASMEAYNSSRGALSAMVGEVSSSAQSLSGASQQMAATSEEAGRAVNEIAHAVGDVAQGAERQVRAVDTAKAKTEQMVEATQTSAQSAQETAKAAQEARVVADEGAERVTQATKAMQAVRDSSQATTLAIRELGAKSGQIGEIVDTITGIAEQTNLLALNAAIEAARAGEQGRGFAVVAEEVRKLAEESQQAAASIAHLIGEIQAETSRAVDVVEDGAKRTDEGVETVEQAREAFERIGSSVADMSARVEQIAAAIDQIASSGSSMQEDIAEVAAVAEQSSASSEEVSASTQETSASTQQIAASAQSLATTATQLEQLVGRFTLERA